MASTFSPPLTGDDDNHQQDQQRQRRSADIPSNFVLGRPLTGPGRLNNNQQYTNGGGGSGGGGGVGYTQISDSEHNLALFDRLSSDLANLLNRTDISDCFLNVKGRMRFIFSRY